MARTELVRMVPNHNRAYSKLKKLRYFNGGKFRLGMSPKFGKKRFG